MSETDREVRLPTPEAFLFSYITLPTSTVVIRGVSR